MGEPPGSLRYREARALRPISSTPRPLTPLCPLPGCTLPVWRKSGFCENHAAIAVDPPIRGAEHAAAGSEKPDRELLQSPPPERPLMGQPATHPEQRGSGINLSSHSSAAPLPLPGHSVPQDRAKRPRPTRRPSRVAKIVPTDRKRVEPDPFLHVPPTLAGAIAGKLVHALRREAIAIGERELFAALRAAGHGCRAERARVWIRRARDPWVRQRLRPRSPEDHDRRILVAAYRTVAWAGRPSIRAARELAAALGAKIRHPAAVQVLAPFEAAQWSRPSRWRNLRPFQAPT